jgi:hypothetical protein
VQALLPTVPTLVVSTIFCLYDVCQRRRRRDRALRERVAYMLWVMAGRLP